MTLERLSALATKRLIRIGELERQLSAERAVTNAFSKLVYHPDQDRYALGGLKKALTMRNQLLNPNAPDQPTAP
jgi:hypothetical protein